RRSRRSGDRDGGPGIHGPGLGAPAGPLPVRWVHAATENDGGRGSDPARLSPDHAGPFAIWLYSWQPIGAFSVLGRPSLLLPSSGASGLLQVLAEGTLSSI